MRTVLIPMMGKGERFKQAGYKAPKPFMPAANIEVLRRVVKSIPPHDKLLIVARQELMIWLEIYPGDKLILEQDTRGAVETCLIGGKLIPPNSEVLIVNCDNYVVTDWEHFFRYHERNTAASILTFPVPPGPDRWSYVLSDTRDLVVKTAEKQRFSEAEKRGLTERACAGVYWFKSVLTMNTMLNSYMNSAEARLTGELYLTPAFNMLKHANVSSWLVDEFHDFGTPEALKTWEKQYARALKAR